MRYLHKVIFINSASIAYAEVMVDGNVHFIGTQGVGKSTLLRSILFFYNADTLKLGISREKKNFAEYYLPYANSYIIYEVVKETGPFSIMAFKSQGKVCYRFIDAPFNKDIYIDPDGTVLDSWDKIRARLDIQRIDFSRKIDRYEEYRDILYGNNEGKKELKKYSFLESRQYQNIPRTIQNVFLNSKLEAEFIKETIIHSLSDEDIVIKLDTYQYQLKDFEEQLKDIRQFRQPTVQKQACQVANLYLDIKMQEREKEALALQLEISFETATQQQPRLLEDIENETDKKLTLQAKLDDLKKRFDNKKEKIQGEITLLDDKIKTAKEKKSYYEKINIEEVTTRVAKKLEVEKKLGNLQEEKSLLSAQYRETTQKYSALLKELDNQFAEISHLFKQEQLEAEKALLQQKEALRAQYAALVETITKQHQEKLAEGLQAVEEAGNRLTAAEVKAAEAKHRHWYNDEIAQADKDIQLFEGSANKARQNIKGLQARLSTTQKQWEVEEAARLDKKEREKEKSDDIIAALQQQVNAIKARLDNTKGSLYEWLNNNRPGWDATIGKICNEDVLFMSDLNPKDKGSASSMYGVSIDLKEIEKTARTAEDYEAEKRRLLQQIEKLTQQWHTWKEKWEDETEKLHKKISVHLREIKDETREQEYALQQAQQKLAAAKLMLSDWQKKAADDKQNALIEAGQLVSSAVAERALLKDGTKKIEDEIDRQVRLKEKEKEQKIATLSQQAAEASAQTEVKLADLNNEFNDRSNTIKQQQQNELTASGADTKRLNEIEQQLGILISELQFIEKKRDTVAEFKKDKRELLDKAEDFKNSRQQLHQQLLTEESKFTNLQRELLQQVEQVMETITAFQVSLSQVNEDLEEYRQMLETGWYQKNVADKNLTFSSLGKRCKDLARLLKEVHYSIIEKVNDIKEVVNRFLSHFSSNNIFKFSAILINKNEYLEFADKLQQFIEDNRIAEFEKRVNERYASIIKLIGKETNDLTSSEGEIQRIITRINNDFTQNNSIAVGVIQKIEMKMDESDNKVVQVLKLIQKFNAESGFELGVANLFTQNDTESKNKKAVDLLKQLIKEIQNLRRDTISLSDSFEIKFRIVENKNDTGWVERLANVGSEGTDVLVKAMINIMLLNVFKEGASKRFKDFKLHCMMDEIGRLHPVNVRGILNFASARNIWLINGSPTENDALAYRHIYKLEKDSKSITRVKRILSQHNLTS